MTTEDTVSAESISPAAAYTASQVGEYQATEHLAPSTLQLYMEVVPILLLNVLCVMGNTLLVYTICHCRQLHTISNGLILNLGVTDLVVALLVLPPWAGSMLSRQVPLHAHLCTAVGVLTILLFLESLSTLAVIALDRYLCICHPLHYPHLVTPARAASVLAYTWLQSAILACVPLANFGRYQFQPSVLYICTADFGSNRSFPLVLLCMTILPACVLIALCYWRIFVAARRQARRIADISSSLPPPQPIVIDHVNNINNQQGNVPATSNPDLYTSSRAGSPVPRIIQIAWDRMRRTTSRTGLATSSLWLKASRSVRKSLRQGRAIRTVFTIIGCFLACWLPFILLMVYSAVHFYQPSFVLDYLVTYLAFSNSLANPVICALVNKEYRRAMLWSLHVGRQQHQQDLMRQVVQALTPTTAPAVRTIFLFPSTSDLTSEQDQTERIRKMYATP